MTLKLSYGVPVVKKPEPKPLKFDKPGSIGGKPGATGTGTGMKFRSLHVKRGVGRPRKRPADPRFVRFF